MKKTDVLFLWELDSPTLRADIFAYFPNLPNNSYSNMCYAHVGQHSGCVPEYAAKCKEADLNEYYHSLLPELVRIGYDNLNILNNQLFTYHRKPTQREVKFGEGATHYRDFLACECINCKGKLRTWLKADDGLRYYR